MSELKTNKIQTNDTNNVAIDNALGLKSYDTNGMNALTSSAGDMIYNTTEEVPYFYDGSSWQQAATPNISVEYLVVAGGGGGAGGGGNGALGPTAGTAGTDGTGGGGGGSSQPRSGTAGGDGIVIVRYSV